MYRKFLGGLTLILIVLLHYQAGMAYSDQSGNYEYELLEDGTAKITTCLCDESDIIIPDMIDGYVVSEIGDFAFASRIGFPKNYETIMIPNSVITMGFNPFVGCEKLREFVVSEDHPSLEVINGVLFDKQLKKLICYPKSLEYQEYAIPEGTRIIGAHAFYYCENLLAVGLPEGVTTIEEHAFQWCFNLLGVALPNSLQTIEAYAFDGCSEMEVAYLSSNVSAIAKYAFSGCNSLWLTVEKGSYSEEYCRKNKLMYSYPKQKLW